MIIVCVILIFLVLFFWSGYVGYRDWKLSKILDIKTEELEETYQVMKKNTIEDVAVLETKDGNTCVVYSNRENSSYDGFNAGKQICPQSYLVFENIQGEKKTIEKPSTYDSRYLMDYTVFQVDIYDIETKKYVKTIDINAILKNYPMYTAEHTVYVVWNDNKEQLAIKLEPSDERAYDKENWKHLVIDIETEKVVLHDWLGIFWNTSNETATIDELRAWIDETGFIALEGYDETDDTVEYTFVVGQFNNWPGMIEMEISTNQLPKENDKLYAMFPELKDYIGLDGYSTTLILKEEVAKELFLEE